MCIIYQILLTIINIGYQIEISRIKMIEDENSRLNQAMDKSNIGNASIQYYV